MRESIPGSRRLSAVWAAIVSLGAFPTLALAQTTEFEKSSVIPFRRAAAENDDRRPTVKVIADGDSTRPLRTVATEEIPWSQLNPAAKERAAKVVQNVGLFRRLPTVSLESDRRTYNYFVDHPDVAVSLWRAMGISKVQLSETGPLTFDTDTGDGTTGSIEVLHRTPNSCLFFCRGLFQNPALVKPIRVEALMHLQPEFRPANQVVHKLDMFVAFPSQTVENIAKIISPVSNRIADRNFEEISLFVEMMNRGMSRQPGWVEQIVMRLEGVDPHRPDELLQVTAAVYIDAQKVRHAQSGEPITIPVSLPMTGTRQIMD